MIPWRRLLLHLRAAARSLLPWLSIAAGGLLSAYGYAALVMPNGMIEGGVTGLGMLARRLLGLPAGAVALALTTVVFVLGLKVLGRGFGLRTLFGVVVANTALDFFDEVLRVQPLTDDPILAAVWGGATCGAGLGLVYYWGGATGGSDTLAQILLKLFQLPVGRTLLLVDALVLGLSAVFYGPEPVMYSLLMIFVEVKVIDLVLMGSRASVRAMIISRRPVELRRRILSELDRGVTIYRAEGGYTGQERIVLATIVPRRMLPSLRRLVAEVDPESFMMVQDVRQVYGRGFDRLQPRGLRKREPERLRASA